MFRMYVLMDKKQDVLFMNTVKLPHDYEKQCNIELNCCVAKLYIIYSFIGFVLKQFLCCSTSLGIMHVL